MVKLYINDTEVDTYDDITIPLNRAIADIATPESRNSDYTKTVTIPGTKANNALFTFIFDVTSIVEGSSTTNFMPDFNPNLKATCKITEDGVTQLEGYVQLLQINIVEQKIEYEVAIFGRLSNLFVDIGSDKLGDLYFDEYDHTFNRTNVVNSWNTSIKINGSNTAFQLGRGYVYPLIDYGYTDEINAPEVYMMRPALYAKTVVDKIFSTYGYTYKTGSFFESDVFKHLIIPYTGTEFGNSEVEQLDNKFTFYTDTVPSTTIGNTIVSDSEYNDIHNQYNTANGEITFYDSRTRKFTGTVNALNSTLPNWGFTHVFRFYIDLIINNVVVNTIQFDGNLSTIRDVSFDLGYQVCESGKVAKFVLSQVTDITDGIIYTSGYNVDLFIGCTVEINPYAIGDTVSCSTLLPKDVFIKDFLIGLIRMFNLYIDTTDVDKELNVQTREAYLTDNILDWSKKLDISQKVEIIPMGMLDANPYLFTYKPDTDAYNKAYTDEYTKTYGEYRYYVANDFIRQEKKTELCFSPTVLVRRSDYITDIITSSMRNYDNNGNLVVKGGNIRILYYDYLPTDTGFSLLEDGTAYPYDHFPYAGHLDNPYLSYFDLNFGLLEKIYFSYLDGSAVSLTDANLFKTYYKTFIDEIAGKDSKMIRAWFRLRPLDIEEADFSKIYYLMGQYFRLNKIIDHEIGRESLTQCEFIKTTIQQG